MLVYRTTLIKTLSFNLLSEWQHFDMHVHKKMLDMHRQVNIGYALDFGPNIIKMLQIILDMKTSSFGYILVF